jgi:hypothetical protein
MRCCMWTFVPLRCELLELVWMLNFKNEVRTSFSLNTWVFPLFFESNHLTLTSYLGIVHACTLPLKPRILRCLEVVGTVGIGALKQNTRIVFFFSICHARPSERTIRCSECCWVAPISARVLPVRVYPKFQPLGKLFLIFPHFSQFWG